MKTQIVHASVFVLVMTSLLNSASAFAFRLASSTSTCVTITSSSRRPISSAATNRLQKYNGQKSSASMPPSVQIFGRQAIRLFSTTDDVGVDAKATTNANEASATDSLAAKKEDGNGSPSQSQGDTETWQNHRSRWAKRKHKRKMKKLEEENGDLDAVERMENDGLSWEQFDFGFRWAVIWTNRFFGYISVWVLRHNRLLMHCSLAISIPYVLWICTHISCSIG